MQAVSKQASNRKLHGQPLLITGVCLDGILAQSMWLQTYCQLLAVDG